MSNLRFQLNFVRSFNAGNTVLKKLTYILIVLPTLIFAQINAPLNRQWTLNDSAEHLSVSCFKPYIVELKHQVKDKSKNIFIRKFKKESLLIVSDTADKFYLTVDPLFNFEFGKDLADSSGEKLYKNTRGVLVQGAIGKKFSFESSFYENQATYTQYIDDYIKSTNDLFPQTYNYDYSVIPGQGRAKKFKTNGYDFAMASGYISYSPSKIINIQLGHGKHFIGDGYRSLLLSDNAFNYPYARVTTTYKNIQYTNLYTSFMNLTNGGVTTPANVERLFQKKIGSFQLLTMNIFKRLQLGVFQGMIWEAADTMNRQHTNFNTFNPIIGINTAVYGLNNTNNLLLGGTLRLKITNSISLYGQYLLDDTYSKNDLSEVKKKQGYQLGIKYFNVLNVKNLHVQCEYNNIRPYTYSTENTYQSYTHYNQALAHPLGANFKEMIGFINYRFKDFFIELKANYAIKGNDSSSYHFGGNIFKSDNTFPIGQSLENITTTQGVKTTILYQDIHVGYLVNPATNFNIAIGISNRIEQTTTSTNKTQFVYLGIRTSLANFYYDF